MVKKENTVEKRVNKAVSATEKKKTVIKKEVASKVIRSKAVAIEKEENTQKGSFKWFVLSLLRFVYHFIFLSAMCFLVFFFFVIVSHYLSRFYESFPVFCEVTRNSIITRPYGLAAVLVLFTVFLASFLRKKLETYIPTNKKTFYNTICIKMPKFIKNIFCLFLSLAIGFAILLFAQYCVKKISGTTFCVVRYISDACRKDPLMCVAKPIIYLYPTETTDVSVKLGAKEKLTHTYPKYVDEWKVRAEPNGDLTDTVTGRKYYALYWEGKDADLPRYDDGFVVAKDEVVPFLEEKLAKLGLNEREANEFIIYWLPKLESAPYTFVHFVSQDEQDKNMPLTVQPKPDTIIRVLMAFKTLDKPIEVKEQVLPEMPKRDGFTVIEWGGTEIPVL